MSDVLDKFLAELEASEVSRQGATICAIDTIFYCAYRERRRIKEERRALQSRKDYTSISYQQKLCLLRVELGSIDGLAFMVRHENRVRRWIWNRIWKKEVDTLNPDQFVEKFMNDMELELFGQELVAKLLIELQRGLAKIPA